MKIALGQIDMVWEERLRFLSLFDNIDLLSHKKKDVSSYIVQDLFLLCPTK